MEFGLSFIIPLVVLGVVCLSVTLWLRRSRRKSVDRESEP